MILLKQKTVLADEVLSYQLTQFYFNCIKSLYYSLQFVFFVHLGHSI